MTYDMLHNSAVARGRIRADTSLAALGTSDLPAWHATCVGMQEEERAETADIAQSAETATASIDEEPPGAPAGLGRNVPLTSTTCCITCVAPA